MTYRDYLLSDHWQHTKTKKLALVGYRCDSCASQEQLQVHHLTYETLRRESDQDLMVFCDNCHHYAHILWKIPPSGLPVEYIRVMLLYFLPRHNALHGQHHNAGIRRITEAKLLALPKFVQQFYAMSVRQFASEIAAPKPKDIKQSKPLAFNPYNGLSKKLRRVVQQLPKRTAQELADIYRDSTTHPRVFDAVKKEVEHRKTIYVHGSAHVYWRPQYSQIIPPLPNLQQNAAKP